MSQEAASQRDEVLRALVAAAARHCEEWAGDEHKPTAPVAVVAVSAASGERLQLHHVHLTCTAVHMRAKVARATCVGIYVGCSLSCLWHAVVMHVCDTALQHLICCIQ